MLAYDTPPPIVTPTDTPPPSGPPTATVSGRKRKQAPTVNASAASTPPPDGTSGTPAPTTTVISDRSDLSTRERRTISRYPLFLPIPSSSQPFSSQPNDPIVNEEEYQNQFLFHTTDGIPHNSHRFRYYPAGVNAPGSILTCRTIESLPTAYRVSWEDRSPFLKVTKDGLRMLGDKGFRSARGNAPIREGKWYMEIKIEKGGGELGLRQEGAHVRLGWSRRESPLNGPVGIDGYSYGYRDKTGDRVTLSRPKPYGSPFSSGDVVGMYICLPSRSPPAVKDPRDPAHIKRQRIPIDFKGQEYFETQEYAQSKEMTALMDAQTNKPNTSASLPSTSKKSGATVKNSATSNPRSSKSSASTSKESELRPIPTLGPNSYIAFFVNGQSQGIAYQDLFDYIPLRSPASAHYQKRRRTKEGAHEHIVNLFDDGMLGYYPTISLFNDARVKINPGPDFDYPPPDDVDALLASGSDDNKMDVKPDMEVDVKPSISVDDVAMDVDVDQKPSSRRTWRPICERYAEFMTEQWNMDDIDETRARENVANVDDPTHTPPTSQAAPPKPVLNDEDEDKRQKRLAKRRAQAAARKQKAKLAQAAQSKKVDDLLGIPALGGSPLRQSATPYSPAPTPGTGDVYSPAPTPDPTSSRMYSPAPTPGTGAAYSPAQTPDVYDDPGMSRPHSPAQSASSGIDPDADGERVYEEQAAHSGYNSEAAESEDDGLAHEYRAYEHTGGQVRGQDAGGEYDAREAEFEEAPPPIQVVYDEGDEGDGGEEW